MKNGVYTQLCPVMYGCGSVQKTGEVVKSFRVNRVLVVTGAGIVSMGYEKRVLDSLHTAGVEAVLWTGAKPECDSVALLEGVEQARKAKVQAVIGLGGGSTMDTAKAIAQIAPYGNEVFDDFPGYLHNFAEGKAGLGPGLPVILIPTTFGTGSECTFVAVINDRKADVKIGFPSVPAYAIVDPDFSLDTPESLTGGCALDAFSHAAESLSNVNATEHSDLLSRTAMELIATYLPLAMQEPHNVRAREQLALASNFAGIAFSEAGTHIGHAVAHALGHVHHIPHGVACALALPAMIELQAQEHPEDNQIIAKCLELTVSSQDSGEIAQQTADGFRALMRTAKIKPLSELGVTREETLALLPVIMADPIGLAYTYAGSVQEEKLNALLSSMYDNYQ